MADPNTSPKAISDPIRSSSASTSPALEVDPFARILGRSMALREVISRARTVARVDSSVLINGESGTGKELIARGIHESSPRARAPFVALNCATLAESLQGSTLFGHAKGAFTGALRDQAGLFEAAHEGTLFLDEVAELASSAQAELLRVLQEGVITRIGEHQERTVDVRLIAATHRDLDDAIQAGTFRNDLFFRLNVVGITVPALRERDDDALLSARLSGQASHRKEFQGDGSVRDTAAMLRLEAENHRRPGQNRRPARTGRHPARHQPDHAVAKNEGTRPERLILACEPASV